MKTKQRMSARPTFCEWWNNIAWNAMGLTGHGYRRPSLGRDGTGERRADKRDGRRKAFRQYERRYSALGR